MKTVEKGRFAEDAACEYLEQSGITVIDRNHRFMGHEVDIVCYQGEEIVFVEVRSKSTIRYGYPEETVDKNKQKSIILAAEAWLYEKRMEGARIRFDVISVLTTYQDGEMHQIEHFRNAFWY
jgi:putative endonuclease